MKNYAYYCVFFVGINLFFNPCYADDGNVISNNSSFLGKYSKIIQGLDSIIKELKAENKKEMIIISLLDKARDLVMKYKNDLEKEQKSSLRQQKH